MIHLRSVFFISLINLTHIVAYNYNTPYQIEWGVSVGPTSKFDISNSDLENKSYSSNPTISVKNLIAGFTWRPWRYDTKIDKEILNEKLILKNFGLHIAFYGESKAIAFTSKGDCEARVPTASCDFANPKLFGGYKVPIGLAYRQPVTHFTEFFGLSTELILGAAIPVQNETSPPTQAYLTNLGYTVSGSKAAVFFGKISVNFDFSVSTYQLGLALQFVYFRSSLYFGSTGIEERANDWSLPVLIYINF